MKTEKMTVCNSRGGILEIPNGKYTGKTLQQAVAHMENNRESVASMIAEACWVCRVYDMLDEKFPKMNDGRLLDEVEKTTGKDSGGVLQSFAIRDFWAAYLELADIMRKGEQHTVSAQISRSIGLGLAATLSERVRDKTEFFDDMGLLS